MCHSVSSEQAPKTRTAAESDYKAHVARQDLFAEIALNRLGIDLDLGGSELDLQQVSIAAVRRALRAAYLAGVVAACQDLRRPSEK